MKNNHTTRQTRHHLTVFVTVLGFAVLTAHTTRRMRRHLGVLVDLLSM